MRSSGTRGLESGGRGVLAAAVIVLSGALLAGPAAAQVYVVTPDPDEREASAATTIMLNPFYLAQNFDVSDVEVIEMSDGSQRINHPAVGVNFFTATVGPDGEVATGCDSLPGYKQSSMPENEVAR